MAGARRAAQRPTKRHASVERRRTALNNRLAQTSNPLQRTAIAFDYLRGALTRNPDPASAEEIVVRLVKTADRLYEGKETR